MRLGSTDLKVSVLSESLLEKLRENKAKHEFEYEAAIEGWREDAAKELLKVAELVKNADGKNRLYLQHLHSAPKSHVEDYDRAIGMMEMCTTETIELGASDFDELVNDNWDWKEDFLASNSQYSKAM